VRDFLGRDEEFSAFSNWLNEEFEGEIPVVSQFENSPRVRLIIRR